MYDVVSGGLRTELNFFRTLNPPLSFSRINVGKRKTIRKSSRFVLVKRNKVCPKRE